MPDKRSNDGSWDKVIDGAILNLLGKVGKADLDGLLHVLQRERIRVDEDSLNKALARLSDDGRVVIELDDASKSPRVKLGRPFHGWT